MTILLKDGQVIDGKGTPAARADIFIKDNKISAIGVFPNKKADVVVNCMGLYVAPGFIDINTSSDHYLTLFTSPAQKDFLLQGVTTIIGGNCGASLAPLVYGTLEAIRKWGDPKSINVNWHTLGEFLAVLKKRGVGVNFGTLIGHATIRRALVGDAMRDLTESELKVFEKMVEDAMDEGAFGLSTGLAYSHSKLVPYNELKRLVQKVAQKNGVYTTHLRNEGAGLLNSVQETVALAKETHAKTQVSHLKALQGFTQEYEKALDFMRRNGEGANLHFDMYPFDLSNMVVYAFLPQWAQRGGFEGMLALLADEEQKKRVLGELPKLDGKEMRILHAPGNEYLKGKTLAEFAKNRELPEREALVRLMELTKLRAVVECRNIDAGLMQESLKDDLALIASSAASDFDSIRARETFPRFLELITRNIEVSLESAVRKITSLPAQIYGIEGRGEIKEGNFADIVILNHAPNGDVKKVSIQHVLVNGAWVVKEGVHQQTLAGSVLLHE